MLIDVGFEALIGNIHLTETCKDLVGAGVVVFGDVGLQFFYKCLSLGRVSGVPVIHTFGEFGKNCVQAIVYLLPFIFGVAHCLFGVFFVSVCFAPAFFYFYIVIARGFLLISQLHTASR